MTKQFKYLILTIILISCSNDNGDESEFLEFINSITVAFAYTGQELNDFFQNPDKAYVKGYLYFEPDLAEDIIFGLDIEWLEGVEAPFHFEGADWMALAGFQRNGTFWFRTGSPENLSGTPTVNENWEIIDLGQELSPNTWYEMTIEADFGLREFISVKILGGSIDQEFNLNGFQLDYPNYIPFDQPSLTYYTFAIRSKEFAPENQGGTEVYFDDLEVGLRTTSGNSILFSNSFENQNQVQNIPFDLPVSPIDNIIENFWYLENDGAKVNITNENPRTGQQSIVCNADLSQN